MRQHRATILSKTLGVLPGLRSARTGFGHSTFFHGDIMNQFLKALFIITASALTAQPLAAVPVRINDHLGDWSSAAAPYAAGNMVIHAHKTWLSLVNGNTSKPGASGTAGRWRLVGHVRPFDYQVGDRGPGGGVIFFVDRDDQFPRFDYLEAAPDDLGGHAWCNRTKVSIPAAKARAVGRGKANTRAMLRVCASGAARAAVGYRGPNGKDDWFLPSLGELKLMRGGPRKSDSSLSGLLL